MSNRSNDQRDPASARLSQFARIERREMVSPITNALKKRAESRGSKARIKAFLEFGRNGDQGGVRSERL